MVRTDGMLFWQYQTNGSEYWVSKEDYEKRMDATRKIAASYRQKNRLVLRERADVYRKANYDSIRKRQLMEKFGISLEKYNEIFKKQKGVCAICSQKCETGKQLAVDHCHKTGKVRGLLCQPCNTALGKFREKVEYIANAIEYLEKNS